MKLSLFVWHERLFGSLWFVPTLIILGGIGVAVGLTELDRAYRDTGTDILFEGSPTSARTVMGTIGASVLAIIGVSVPLTIVALQLAAGQFSQRILRNFLTDRIVQIFLGVFVAVFAYSLLVLRVISDADVAEDAFVPNMSITAGVLASLLSLGLFVVFINHIMDLIQLSNIIQNISTETQASMLSLYPEPVGTSGDAQPIPPPPDDARFIPANKSGYLQAVDGEALFHVARDRAATVWIRRLPGAFCSEGSALFAVVGLEANDETAHELNHHVQIGGYRTVENDALFGIRQIVDVAARALSPGVNDPTTAVQCLDYLQSLLITLTQRAFPSPVRADDSGTERLIVTQPDFHDYVAEAFDQVREFGEGNVAVTRRLIEAVGEVLGKTEGDRRECLVRQMQLTLEGARRSVKEPADLEALERIAAHHLRRAN